MPDRRAFLLGSLAAGLTPAAAAPRLRVQDDPPPDPVSSDVEARMALILSRYGDRLDDEARGSVRRDVEALVRRARRLRRFPLSNGDGPALILVPYRATVESVLPERESR